MENRNIKATVIKQLYAQSGNQCAFPGCGCPLFEVSTDGKTHKGKICHIEGLNPQSARYNPNSTDEERNSFDNLILLCANHHEQIDQNPEIYTVAYLKEMKARHNAEVRNKIGKKDSLLPIEERNKIISATRNACGMARHLKKRGWYKPAYVESGDVEYYNWCVMLWNACTEIDDLERKNHVQLHAIGLDSIIRDILEELPSFTEEDGFGTGLICTVHDYWNFATSDKCEEFIKNCEKTIHALE